MSFLRIIVALSVVVIGLILTRVYGADGASLHGRVLDGRAQPVSDAMVVLRAGPTAQPLMTLSGRDGAYAFGDLQPGVDYELLAEHEALASRLRTLRVSNPDEKVTIDLTLVAPVQFEDITAKAGLDFTLRNGATGRYYQPEIMTGGVAALDYNNDGCMDIYFVNGAALPSLIKTGPEYRNRLYRNNCDSSFTDVTGSAHLAGDGYARPTASAASSPAAWARKWASPSNPSNAPMAPAPTNWRNSTAYHTAAGLNDRRRFCSSTHRRLP